MTTSGGAVGSPAISAVYLSTITATWTTVPNVTGYDVEASTMANFTGTIFSTATTNTSAITLTVSSAANLAPDTTYFVRIGALYNGATTYIATVPSSTSTLASLVTNGQVYQVFATSITANWFTFSSGSGANTSQGYHLDAPTAANFRGTIYSSTTFLAADSTLTVSGLAAFTTYYLRVGDLNWNNATNYVSIGSTMTTSGGAVGSPAISAVYLSTITATWTTVPNVTGYDVEASTMSNFTGTIFSTVTTNTSAITLTVSSAANLAPDTTYFIRIGALYNGATTYIATVPSSTSTLASLVTNGQVYQVFATSITANWFTFSSGSGANTSQGYELDASTAANFTGTIYSSTTFLASNSTLTVSGLAAFTTYYLRVGDLNWNNATNYASIGSTMTTSGGAVGSPAISAVYLSTITATWTTVPHDNASDVEASTMSNFTSG